jgi:hypothetical protein
VTTFQIGATVLVFTVVIVLLLIVLFTSNRKPKQSYRGGNLGEINAYLEKHGLYPIAPPSISQASDVTEISMKNNVHTGAHNQGQTESRNGTRLCPLGHCISEHVYPYCATCETQKLRVIGEAKARAIERMHDLCVGCLYHERIECPLECVRDVETLNALVPQNCHKWKPKC